MRLWGLHNPPSGYQDTVIKLQATPLPQIRYVPIPKAPLSQYYSAISMPTTLFLASPPFQTHLRVRSRLIYIRIALFRASVNSGSCTLFYSKKSAEELLGYRTPLGN